MLIITQIAVSLCGNEKLQVFDLTYAKDKSKHKSKGKKSKKTDLGLWLCHLGLFAFLCKVWICRKTCCVFHHFISACDHLQVWAVHVGICCGSFGGQLNEGVSEVSSQCRESLCQLQNESSAVQTNGERKNVLNPSKPIQHYYTNTRTFFALAYGLLSKMEKIILNM